MANELILVVEDHDKNRKLVRDVLTFKGYEIIEAETGEEGVRLAQERHPSLVLIDIRLPGMGHSPSRCPRCSRKLTPSAEGLHRHGSSSPRPAVARNHA